MNETFDSLATGERPAGWSYTQLEEAFAIVAEVPDSTRKSMQISKAAATDVSFYARTPFPSGLEKASVSVRVMAMQTNALVYAPSLLGGNGQALVQFGFNSNGYISYLEGTRWIPLQRYEAGRWYDFTLALDTVSQTYDISIDGVLTKARIGFQTSAVIAQLQIGIFRTDAGTAYYDSIGISPYRAVQQLTVQPASTLLEVGDRLGLAVSFEPADATFRSVEWSSSNPLAAKVDANGIVTAASSGEAVIAATASDGGIRATSVVQVQPSDIVLGELLHETFNRQPIGSPPAGWSFTTTDGAFAVIAEAPSTSGQAMHIVKPIPTDSSFYARNVLLQPASKTTLVVRAMAMQNNAMAYPASVIGTNGQSVAQVAFYNDGYLAVLVGTTWQRVQPYEPGRWYEFRLELDADAGTYNFFIDGSIVRTRLPFLNPVARIEQLQFGIYRTESGAIYLDWIAAYDYRAVETIGLEPAEFRLSVGNRQQATARIMPDNAAFRCVEWSSSDPGVAEVDMNGIVTGKSAGEATITATSADGSLSASAAVEVFYQPVTGIELNAAEATHPVDSILDLEAIVQPANATDRGVRWSSSDETVAVVNEEGEAFLVGTGTAVIAAVSNDGEFRAECAVTVVPRTVQADYYVSPDGDDGNPGTEAAPFGTLERARDAVRAIQRPLIGDVRVILRGGTYALNDTFALDERDSGSNGYRIVYQAYSGEKAVIGGGKAITGWTLHDPEKNIYRAYAGGDIETRQLYVNGVRGIRARSAGGLSNATWDDGVVGHTTTDTFLAEWGNISDMEMVYKSLWTNSRMGVESITAENGIATIKMKQPGWYYVTHKGSHSAKAPWYYENAYELLDEEGEWYLDRTTDTFYYKPREGEDLASAEVIAPVLEKLITAEGSSLDAPIRDVRFEGLSFAYTTWLHPNGSIGHPDAQNNHIRTNGIDTLPDAAITVRRANGIVFERNEFSKLGSTALKMVQGVRNSMIRGNKFYDLSGGAVTIGEPTRNDPAIFDPPDSRLLMKNNDVVNNYIHDIGVEYRSASAISAGFPVDMDISHNEIFNIPYSGIHIGYGWQFIPTSAIRNVRIERNFIYDLLGAGLYDGGAVYTLGGTGGTADSPNVIAENYIKNQMNQSGALYPDEGSTFWRIDRNVVDLRKSTFWENQFVPRWLHIWTNSIREITLDGNYTTTAYLQNSGVDIRITDTRVYPNGQWPQEALDIIARSGLEAEYRDIGEMRLGEVAAPETVNLNSGEFFDLPIAVLTPKGEPFDLGNVTRIEYGSEDAGVVLVDGQGKLTAAGSGKSKVTVAVTAGNTTVTATVNVYVDDRLDRIEPARPHETPVHVLLDSSKRLETIVLSLYGQILSNATLQFASRDPDIVSVDGDGWLAAHLPGASIIDVTAAYEGAVVTESFAVQVIDYEGTALNDAIADFDAWLLDGHGTKSGDENSITLFTPGVTPSGFATYQGRTYGDDQLVFFMNIESIVGWPSISLRNRQPDLSIFDAGNEAYMITFKPDIIEVQRFNAGVRTVLFGFIEGQLGIGGEAIPNRYFTFGQDMLVQTAAVNEAGGVRLTLRVNGYPVMDFLDEGDGRIAESGYFGVYAKSGNITFRNVPIDTTPPTTVDDAQPGWHRQAQTITLTATDDRGSVAKTMYSLNDGPFAEGNTIAVDGEGAHTIRYYSIDRAGNQEVVRQTQVKIDLTPPTIEISASAIGPAGTVPGPTFGLTDRIQVSVSLADALSGIASGNATLDGEAVALAFVLEPMELSIGSHTIAAEALDHAGNEAVGQYVLEVQMDLSQLKSVLKYAGQMGWIRNRLVLHSLLAMADYLMRQTDRRKLLIGLKALENMVRALSGRQIDAAFADRMIEEIIPHLAKP
ncbi:Ig-like domain-containing protein [Cohnella massiliensis]|uniref:Ig-like domain-containing protein n=1 Tax=Cohnella massiliensis TaxID=1816691 RepID=UPI0009BBC926|nr:Ig-like domain-containing protein [Cohnella massiliensis]